jgi:uncharacterized protein
MRNVLSIDGGGIRGIVTAHILNNIEKLLQKYTNNKNEKLINYFDLSSGTSTGSIIIAILNIKDKNGIPLYNCQDVLNMYNNESQYIFKRTFIQKIKSLFGIIKVKYDNKYFKEMLKKYLKETTVQDTYTNTMITSINLNDMSLFLFKSYGSNHQYNLTDAVLASSAAPTYFKPIKLYKNNIEITLTDGGMGMNNPSLSSYLECKKLYKDDNINILSLGTGYKTKPLLYNKIKKWGIAKWLKEIVDTILSANNKVTDYQCNMLYKYIINGKYTRINGELFYASSKIDDVSNKNLLNLQKDAQIIFDNNKSEIINFIQTCFIK